MLDSTEVAITEFLSERQKQDSRNHAVPLLDILRVPDHCFLISPLYRTLEHGHERLDTIGEGFDFVDQTLEGLAYLHQLRIAHRDVTIGNIVMDGKRMFPHGFHMERPHRDERGRSLSGVRTRTQVGGVKYYYIDFGESMRFDSDGDIRIDVRSKANIHAPETRGADRPPYDPFKTDIYALGMTYTKLLLKDYEGNFDILTPLLNEMTSEDPALRPSAAQALSKFKEIKSSFSRTALHARVRHDSTPETGTQRILRNSWHWLKQCTYAARNFKW
ncbi:hypothetical protein EWM64_g9077 [Hericium alpestre]|uniref:Protein kinase domain-containing protein n=1 Tax=Hericium alpestre TaxID=135208 RepID=A0A4Y9ZJF7_9AGAM|nr:hypothetical protein EWM64_g9077 [Hericium alpestre]